MGLGMGKGRGDGIGFGNGEGAGAGFGAGFGFGAGASAFSTFFFSFFSGFFVVLGGGVVVVVGVVFASWHTWIGGLASLSSMQKSAFPAAAVALSTSSGGPSISMDMPSSSPAKSLPWSQLAGRALDGSWIQLRGFG